jgi:hypothetical protein
MFAQLKSESFMFWVGIIVMVAIIVGASVLVGKILSQPGNPDDRRRRHAQMAALKASGALGHRKSNN